MNFIILCVAGTLVQQAGNVRFQLHEVSGHFVVQQDHSRGRENSSQAALNKSSPVQSTNICFLDKITSIEQTRQDKITVRFQGGAKVRTKNLERPDVICFGWKGTLKPLWTRTDEEWDPSLRYETEKFFKFCADEFPEIQLFIVSETESATFIRAQLKDTHHFFTDIYGTEKPGITKENFAGELWETFRGQRGKQPVVMMVDAARYSRDSAPDYMAAQKFFGDVDKKLPGKGPGMAYHFMPGHVVFDDHNPVGIEGANKYTREQMLYTFLGLNFGEKLSLGCLPTFGMRKQLTAPKEGNVITR